MLKKSNKISLEEATRLAILGKLPLKESTTVSTSGDGLTTVETDDANIVIEPKENAAVDVGMSAVPCEGPECADETPVEETPIDEVPEDNEPIMMEGKQVKKTEVKSKKVEHKGLKEHKVAFKSSNKLQEGVYAVEYIGSFWDLYESSWGQAKKILDEIAEAGKEEELMDYLESYGDSAETAIDRTELNDLLAFEWEQVFEDLGINENDEDEDLDESKKVEGCEKKSKKEEGEAQLFKNKINKTDIKKVENKSKKEEGEAPLFKKVISKHDIKKIESKKVTEGEAPLFKTKINKTDIKKVEGKDCKDCGKEQKIVEDKLEEKEPKKHVINKVDLKKEEAIKKATAKVIEKKAQANKADFNEKLKTKVAEGLTKFVKEAYTNGKEVKVEKVIRLTENKVYVKGSLVMENSTKDFSCKLVPIKENKSFRKYTIEENKLLKITEGKTTKGKSFNLIVRK